MNPVYYQGDLVVVAKAPTYHVGEIAAYRIPGRNMTVLHRIIAGDPSGFVFKGDNNESIDPFHPTSGQLVGHAVLHISHGGRWLTALTSPVTIALVVFALISTAAGISRTRRRRRKGTAMSRHSNATSPGWPGSLTSMPAPVRHWSTAIAILALAGVAFGALSWALPPAAVNAEPVAPGKTLVFSYSAAVPPSPAYDGVRAASPDPIFRKLADTVNVAYDYQGAPGQITLSASLSTDSGWHSSIALAPPTPVSTSYHHAVDIDLNALAGRAKAAAAATGIPAGQVMIGITASVESAGAAPFTPTLRLALSPLQLTLVGGPQALTVIQPAAVTTPARSSRIWAPLQRLGSQNMRLLAGTSIGVALIGALALALIARGARPDTEAEGIRRRYQHLVVSVEPVSTPTGRPLIDVTDFATLVKLADRYGLLILHWHRSGVDTFVVQDESTTYRFRPQPSANEARTVIPTHEAAR
jgi:hypothetical protein